MKHELYILLTPMKKHHRGDFIVGWRMLCEIISISPFIFYKIWNHSNVTYFIMHDFKRFLNTLSIEQLLFSRWNCKLRRADTVYLAQPYISGASRRAWTFLVLNSYLGWRKWEQYGFWIFHVMSQCQVGNCVLLQPQQDEVMLSHKDVDKRHHSTNTWLNE